jgi:anthranilate phosphoribosyltransferase
MKKILLKLISNKTLDKQEAKNVLVEIANSKYGNAEVASFVTVFMMRSITVEELEGFRDALLELCKPVNLSDFDPIDLCGTGGDGKDTFNISTLASFVTAGAGIKVAKHGNYGVSSVCGSSNVLEYLGIKFTDNVDQLKKNIDEAGICFMHAPLFHPALKNVAPVRKELGVKTFFNMLGPMVNPSFPQKQMVGVFSLELARLYAYLYQQTNKQFVILHSVDGYDEVSLTGEFKFISNKYERIMKPSDLGVQSTLENEILSGGTIEDSADIFMKVLNNESSLAQKNVVCANAAMAIHCYYPELSLHDSFKLAEESLLSKRALGCFKKLAEMN